MGDPMDLGGFMQNFVLKNPFQDVKALKKPPDQASPSPPSNVSTSPPAVRPARYIKIAPKGGKEKPGSGPSGLDMGAPGVEVIPLGSIGTEGV